MAGVPDQFTHAGATIYVEYKAHWTEDDYAIVGDFLEGVNPRVRTARQIAVMRGVKKLTRNRKEIKLKGGTPFPLYKDEESGDTLIEALCRRICAREPMLLEEEPFSMAFAKFAPEEDDEEERDPTPLPRPVSGTGESATG